MAPGWLEFAVEDLYAVLPKIEADATAQRERSAEAHKDRWCRRVSELLGAHLAAHELGRPYGTR